jgi:hypothetical protein
VVYPLLVKQIPPHAMILFFPQLLYVLALWYIEDDIAFALPKKDAPRTVTDEELADDFRIIEEMAGGQKICIIAQANSNLLSPTKSQRDFVDAEFKKIMSALAVIITSPVGRIIVSTFFALKPASFPLKVFSNYEEAFEWVKEHCKR